MNVGIFVEMLLWHKITRRGLKERCDSETPLYEITKNDLAEISYYEEVPWFSFKTSDKPLASFKYGCCSAVIVYLNGYMGLAHMGHGNKSEHYLNGMLSDENLKNATKAMVLATGKEVDRIVIDCNMRGLEVIVDFNYENSENNGIDVIVVPELKEVNIYTKAGKLTKYFE